MRPFLRFAFPLVKKRLSNPALDNLARAVSTRSKFALQESLKEEADAPGTIAGNLMNINHQHLFVLTKLELSLDLKNGAFDVKNYQETKELFLKKFADFSAPENDFERQA